MTGAEDCSIPCRDDGDVDAEPKQKAVSVAQLQQKLTTLKKIAPQGVEPRYLEPKSSVLPLDEGAITMPKAKYKFLAHYWQLTFYFFPLILAHVSRRVIVRFNTSFSSEESESTQK